MEEFDSCGLCWSYFCGFWKILLSSPRLQIEHLSSLLGLSENLHIPTQDTSMRMKIRCLYTSSDQYAFIGIKNLHEKVLDYDNRF